MPSLPMLNSGGTTSCDMQASQSGLQQQSASPCRKRNVYLLFERAAISLGCTLECITLGECSVLSCLQRVLCLVPEVGDGLLRLRPRVYGAMQSSLQQELKGLHMRLSVQPT